VRAFSQRTPRKKAKKPLIYFPIVRKGPSWDRSWGRAGQFRKGGTHGVGDECSNSDEPARTRTAVSKSGGSGWPLVLFGGQVAPRCFRMERWRKRNAGELATPGNTNWRLKRAPNFSPGKSAADRTEKAAKPLNGSAKGKSGNGAGSIPTLAGGSASGKPSEKAWWGVLTSEKGPPGGNTKFEGHRTNGKRRGKI